MNIKTSAMFTPIRVIELKEFYVLGRYGQDRTLVRIRVDIDTLKIHWATYKKISGTLP